MKEATPFGVASFYGIYSLIPNQATSRLFGLLANVGQDTTINIEYMTVDSIRGM